MSPNDVGSLNTSVERIVLAVAVDDMCPAKHLPAALDVSAMLFDLYISNPRNFPLDTSPFLIEPCPAL